MVPVHYGEVCLSDLEDLAAFRGWAKSGRFPERGRFSFLRGVIWFHLGPEAIFTHNNLAMDIASPLLKLVEPNEQGYYFGSGAFLTNSVADFATQPDGLFVSCTALNDGRVVFGKNAAGHEDEVIGTPDMVLEIVSTNSQRKDKEALRELYWQAEIPEFWLVDARRRKPQFTILRRGPKGYTPVRARNGWVTSAVFGHSFRLTRQQDEEKPPRPRKPEFQLEMSD